MEISSFLTLIFEAGWKFVKSQVIQSQRAKHVNATAKIYLRNSNFTGVDGNFYFIVVEIGVLINLQTTGIWFP